MAFDYDLNTSVLLCIDVNRATCDPSFPNISRTDGQLVANEFTDQAAKKIANCTDDFRNAGADVWWTEMNIGTQRDLNEKYNGGWHHVRPDKEKDIIIPKLDESAAKGTSLFNHMRNFRRKTAFLVGVNLNECVAVSAFDIARMGYQTCIVSDLVADGNGVNNNGISQAELLENAQLALMNKGVKVKFRTLKQIMAL